MKKRNILLRFVLLACIMGNGMAVPAQRAFKKEKAVMKQRLHIVTIAVKDLAAMRRFYVEQFGWKPEAENEDIIFFRLNGVLFSLFPEKDYKAMVGDTASVQLVGTATLAYLTATEAETDELFATLKARGVTIVRPPAHTFFGAYTGLVADVEGNLWDIGTNPLIPLDKDGRVITHEDIKHLEQ